MRRGMGVRTSGWTSAGRFLLLAAAFVLVVAGMREAQSIIVPFLISALAAVVCAPPLFWMRRRGVPAALAVSVVVLGILVLVLLVGAIAGSSVQGFSDAVPTYQARLEQQTAAFVAFLEEHGIPIEQETLLEQFNPGAAIQYASRVIRSLGGLLTNTFMIFLTLVFILLEAMALPERLRHALKAPEATLETLRRIAENVNRYMGIKTLISLGTGVIVWGFLSVLGVDFPVLWGLLAFLFNFVPNIGSIVAAVPAVLLALVQFGPGKALIAAGGYMTINVVIGSVLEPRVMGKGLGVSTLVVFLSLVFWGWVFGPVGMLLSVPLTMLVKIAMDSSEETRWISALLGETEAVPPDAAPSEVPAPEDGE